MHTSVVFNSYIHVVNVSDLMDDSTKKILDKMHNQHNAWASSFPIIIYVNRVLLSDATATYITQKG